MDVIKFALLFFVPKGQAALSRINEEPGYDYNNAGPKGYPIPDSPSKSSSSNMDSGINSSAPADFNMQAPRAENEQPQSNTFMESVPVSGQTNVDLSP